MIYPTSLSVFLVLFGGALGGIGPGVAMAEDLLSCKAEIGLKKANIYVQRCLEVSSSTHPPCNVSNPCKLILDEIRQGCQVLMESPEITAPAFCKEVKQK